MEDIEMIDLSFLTKQELRYLNDKIGYTDTEIAILEHLVKQDLNDDGIMLSLHMSRNKYYKVKLNAIYKIIKHAVNN